MPITPQPTDHVNGDIIDADIINDLATAANDLQGQIDAIEVGSTDAVARADAAAAQADIDTHTANTSNPHGTTAAQVGADPTGTASTAVAAHAGATDPHGDRGYTDAQVAAITPGDIGAATASQGTLADSAIQPGDLGAAATSNDYGDLDNLPTLGTAAAQNVDDFATGAEGDLAASAVQPGDLSTVATTGAYSDLSGTPTLGTAAAEDVDAFDAAGTAETAISYAATAGTLGLAQRRASTWWASYLARSSAVADVVIIGDSIAHQDSFGDTMGWAQHLAPLLNGKTMNYRPGTGWRHAQAGVAFNPGATTQAGTASATTPNGYGVTMTNGQKATYVVADATDGISLVYSTFSGAGSIIVRDGVGGTVLATINTDGSTNDGNVWTSSSISSAARTYEIESSGNTKWAGVYLHNGTRAAGVRCWCSGKSGWDTTNADTQRTLDLIGGLTPELVILATGTNDSDANYDARIRSLLANVQGVHAGPVAIVAPYVSSTSTTAKATATRALAEEEGLILIDHARFLGDKAIESSPWGGVGVHPSGTGAMNLAHFAASVLRGDPLAERLRQIPTVDRLFIGGSSATSLTLTAGSVVATAAGGNTATLLGNSLTLTTSSSRIGQFSAGGFTFDSDTSLGRTSAGVIAIGSPLSVAFSSPDGVVWAGHRQVVNAQTGTAYTVANADAAKTIIRNNASASTQTWPQDSDATSLPIGIIVRTFNRGAGAVTHQAGTGATVLVTGTQGQNTWWTAQKIAANTWAVGPG